MVFLPKEYDMSINRHAVPMTNPACLVERGMKVYLKRLCGGLFSSSGYIFILHGIYLTYCLPHIDLSLLTKHWLVHGCSFLLFMNNDVDLSCWAMREPSRASFYIFAPACRVDKIFLDDHGA